MAWNHNWQILFLSFQIATFCQQPNKTWQCRFGVEPKEGVVWEGERLPQGMVL